jgi:exodeoxyribonuclease VIII
MTDAEYHAHPAWSASRLKGPHIGTMLDYWARYEDPLRPPFLPNESMKHGSLVDCFMTEAETFWSRYHVIGDVDRRTKAGKEAWAEAEKVANGRELIREADMATVYAIVARLLADPAIGPILRQPRSSQEPHFWIDDCARECRYKPDLEPEDGSLWDLKLTRSAHPRKFAAQAYALAYDVQLAHYREGYIDRYGREPTRIGFIAYEWAPPHNCSLLTAGEDYLEYGVGRREDAFHKIQECRESGYWPSYGDLEMQLPKYADFDESGGESDFSFADLIHD